MNTPEKYTYEEMDRLREELDILSSLILKIRIDMDLDTFLNEIIFTLRDKVPFDGCNISVIDERGYMRVHKISPSEISKEARLSEEYLEKIYSERIDYRASNDWASIAAREKKEIYYPDIEMEDFLPEYQENLKLYGITGLYYVPIIIGDMVFGTMRFHNFEKPMKLTGFEKKIIQRRVSIVAKAIENFTLYNDIKKKNRTIEMDLELAKELQNKVLPQNLPDMPGVSIETYYMPMIEVGGDFFDFIYPDRGKNEKFGVIMTDVSGHGVSSAFITSMLKVSFQNSFIRKNAARPAKVLSRINHTLLNNMGDHFCTGCYAFFDLKKRKAVFANAGHTPVYRIKRNFGEVFPIRPTGSVMGYFEEIVYREHSINLEPGDRFVFFTDGLTEAINKEKTMFDKKLLSLFYKYYGMPTKEFRDLIIRKLKEHALEGMKETFEDDVALVVIDIE
ncbi:MAG: SpoIIE family protein phosphatase [bacterium]|nr:SpoIIE family protein phosphatase [bacterium]